MLIGNCMMRLVEQPDGKFKACVTSVPYHMLRVYSNLPGEIGREPTVEEWVTALVAVFALVWDKLDDRGTLWIVCGDRVARGKTKAEPPNEWHTHSLPAHEGDSLPRGDVMDLPGRLAHGLQDFGWRWRSDITWAKPGQTQHSDTRVNPSHERILMFAKQDRYDFDQKAVQVPTEYGSVRPGTKGRQRGMLREIQKKWKDENSVWHIPPETRQYGGMAPYPLELARRSIQYSTKPNEWVLDPFCGTGTTGVAAKMLNRRFVGIELNPKFADFANKRIAKAPDQPRAHWIAPKIVTDTRTWLPPLILPTGRLIHGDALREIRKLPANSIDFTLLDPPYASGFMALDWDDCDLDWDEFWEELWRVSKPNGFIAICCDDRLFSRLIRMQAENFRYSLKWFKGNSANFLQGRSQPAKHTEFIAIFGKVAEASYTPQMLPLDAPISRTIRKVHRHLFGKRLNSHGEEIYEKVFRDERPIDLRFYDWEPGEKITFESQKPISMGLDLIKTHTRAGGEVLDLFTGTGTFALAAMRLGYQFIAVERGEKHFQIASDRIVRGANAGESNNEDVAPLIEPDQEDAAD